MDGFRPTREQVVDFLRTQDFGYIATLNDEWPEAVLVGFSCNDRLQVMFGTDAVSAKAMSIVRYQRVGFTVTDVRLRYQVKIRGYAMQMGDRAYRQRQAEHYAKLPSSLRFETEPGQVFYSIAPVKVWFRDLNPEHSRDWVETEIAI